LYYSDGIIPKFYTISYIPKENAKQSVSDDFITELAKRMYPACDALVQVLKPSPQILTKKCEDVHDSLGDFKQQLMYEHI